MALFRGILTAINNGAQKIDPDQRKSLHEYLYRLIKELDELPKDTPGRDDFDEQYNKLFPPEPKKEKTSGSPADDRPLRLRQGRMK
jgi:hypothetical protein